MPKVLQESEIDPIAEEVDQAVMETGEEATVLKHKVDLNGSFGDLSDGGQVGGARLVPQGESGNVDFKKREPGRPTVRRVWTWDGRESMIPLSYEPSGKRHDGGRKYILKRHCVVCNETGFYGSVCPQCRNHGRRIAPPVPAFYLRKEQVPNQQVFFGAVDCFVPTCVRRGQYGFKTEVDMRQHAMSKHRQEYRAYQDAAQSRASTEMDTLRQQVAVLTTAALTAKVQPASPAPAPQAPSLSMTPAAIKVRKYREQKKKEKEPVATAT